VLVRELERNINSVRKMCPVEYVNSEMLVNIEANLRKSGTKGIGQKKKKPPTKVKMDVHEAESEKNLSLVVYDDIVPEVLVNEETLNGEGLKRTEDDVDVDNEKVYDDYANKNPEDDVDWKNDVDPYLEDIIEYYKHTEDELAEVSASGNHLLIRAVSQYSFPHKVNLDLMCLVLVLTP